MALARMSEVILKNNETQLKRLTSNIAKMFYDLFISGSKNSYEIFKYARNAIDPKVEFTRFDVPRAGLRLFARHAAQFNQYLFEDYEVNVQCKIVLL